MKIYNRTLTWIAGALLAAFVLLEAAIAAPPEKVSVTAANPDSALQGESLDVKINGSGFGQGAKVRFLVSGTKDDSQIAVGNVTYNEGDGTLTAAIQVQSTALLSDYDIEVQALSGRKGKGTTLFSVKSSGAGGVDTSAIPLNCQLEDAFGDTILSDGLGTYQDDVDKVLCTTGDSQASSGASHLRMYTVARGNIRNAIRKVDFVIDEGTCTNAAGCAIVPNGVFEAAATVDDMEDGRFAVRAYAGTDGLAVPHIQNLTPGSFYEVAMSFGLQGTVERWMFQLMGRELPDDFKQGEWCALANPADAISDDATLYVWPDADGDGKPDGYTVTTATALNTSTVPPTVVTPASRQATLCSTVDENGNSCGGPGGSDLCHLISKMQVQFTLHSENQ